MIDKTTLRLQVAISQAGICSRRKAEELIASGAVKVNGRVVTEQGTKVSRSRDRILVSGKPLPEPQNPKVFLFHKPRGVITSLRDPQGRPCVGNYLNSIPERLYPVGRLDFDVCGLILLTNDGEFAQKLLHPRYGERRTYWARVRGVPSDIELKQLTKGVELADGSGKAHQVRMLKPSARVRELIGMEEGAALIEIVVKEGRKHFVKRLFQSLGYPVERLCRVGFGSHKLGMLKPGQLVEVKS